MECSLQAFVSVLLLAAGPAWLAAQDAEGVETITAADLARHVEVMAADSMLGRNTPSPGLEATARYVADQFSQVGLRPVSDLAARVPNFAALGGPISTWFERYRIPVEPARLSVVFAMGDRQAVARLTTAAYLPFDEAPKQPAKGSVLLVAGRPSEQVLRDAHFEDKIVLYIPAQADTNAGQFVDWLAEKSRSLVYLSPRDSAAFAERRRAHSLEPVSQSSKEKWVASILPAAAPGLEELLTGAGVPVARLRTDSTSVVRDIPSLQLSLERPPSDANGDTATTAPNVVGMLEGSDSVLKDEYVVISAHMDHIGVVHGETDSIANGTDDNASGTAGLLALAKAFSHAAARPRRSIMFIATSSGATPEFWGSRAFVAGLGITAPIGGMDVFVRVIADINLDMIAGLPHDSVTVDGLRAVDLVQRPQVLAAVHPELQLTVVDGESAFSPESDHFRFATGLMTIPALSFHNGRHEESQRRPDSTVTLDFEQAARIVRLVFYLSQGIANDARPPFWNAEGHREMLQNR